MRRSAKTPLWLTLAGLAIVMFVGATRNGETNGQKMEVPENADYTKFQHTGTYHTRLPCLLCHKRETNAAKPTWPGKPNHLPCAGCHQKQFADNSGPICTICHSNAQSGPMQPSPRLKSFRPKFTHSSHVSVSRLNCESCHRPSQRGIAFTIPSGSNAHTNCFRCHSSGSTLEARAGSSCSVCLQLGRPVRTSENAQAFRVGFSHAKHNDSEGRSCNECHRVAGPRMSSPQPLNHHASARGVSCMTCHDGKRTFGGDDFTACKRCHTANTWRF